MQSGEPTKSAYSFFYSKLNSNKIDKLLADNQGRTEKTTVFCIAFLLVILAIIMANYCIYYFAEKHQNKLRKYQVTEIGASVASELKTLMFQMLGLARFYVISQLSLNEFDLSYDTVNYYVTAFKQQAIYNKNLHSFAVSTSNGSYFNYNYIPSSDGNTLIFKSNNNEEAKIWYSKSDVQPYGFPFAGGNYLSNNSIFETQWYQSGSNNHKVHFSSIFYSFDDEKKPTIAAIAPYWKENKFEGLYMVQLKLDQLNLFLKELTTQFSLSRFMIIFRNYVIACTGDHSPLSKDGMSFSILNPFNINDKLWLCSTSDPRFQIENFTIRCDSNVYQVVTTELGKEQELHLISMIDLDEAGKTIQAFDLKYALYAFFCFIVILVITCIIIFHFYRIEKSHEDQSENIRLDDFSSDYTLALKMISASLQTNEKALEPTLRNVHKALSNAIQDISKGSSYPYVDPHYLDDVTDPIARDHLKSNFHK